MKNHRRQRVAGQAMIYVVMVLVMVAFVVFWQFDLHKTIYVKTLTRDASDAAALAAARWQAISLNLIGDLNVQQAVLVTSLLMQEETDFSEAEALHELRARIAIVGPVIGFAAANQAAHQNHIYNNPFYTAQWHAHAQRVRTEYPRQFAPPWPSDGDDAAAWEDYADMLLAVAGSGLAVLPENPSWFNDYVDRNHPLLNPAFYDAVASRNWCWFFFHERSLLNAYGDWRDWGALPSQMQREPVNAEVFSLRLTPVRTAAHLPVLNPFAPGHRVEEWADQLAAGAGRLVSTNAVLVDVAWHVYHPAGWSEWTGLIPAEFPFQSPVRDRYNVLGADAAVRIYAEADRISPGMGYGSILRTAAAKPFGTLANGERINALGMVLPGFSDVRLIPMDTSTAPESGHIAGWTDHLYEHLPDYLRGGHSALRLHCYYCRQLNQWEDAEFRQQGRAWLEQYSHTCQQTGGSGSGPGGGTRRGH